MKATSGEIVVTCLMSAVAAVFAGGIGGLAGMLLGFKFLPKTDGFGRLVLALAFAPIFAVVTFVVAFAKIIRYGNQPE